MRIGVLAQVPAESQCLGRTLPSLAALGEVTVLSAGAGPEVAAAAAAAGVPVADVPWSHDYGVLMTDAARWLGEGPWLIAYADETVAERGAGAPQAPGPAAAGVRHRTGEHDTYTEENECRGSGAGAAPPEFEGLVYARVRRDGATVDPDVLPHTGVVFEHHPARWPGLSTQRIARTRDVYEHALTGRPDDPELLYGLLHCHYSTHAWDELRAVGGRWRRAAGDADPSHPLVDYYEACAAVARRDPAAARELTERAVERAPGFADGWYLLGELSAASGRDADADREFATAAGIGRAADPVAVEDLSLATWRAWQARAALAKRAGRAADARELLARARRSREELRSGAVAG